MRKIYFACSISAGREHAHVYPDIVGIIKANGMHVLSEIFADKKVTANEGPTPHLPTQKIWEMDVAWLKEADAIIAELTIPSLGIGYELGIAEKLGTPILGLYYTTPGRRLSPMISGNPLVKVIEYNDVSELEKPIAEFINRL